MAFEDQLNIIIDTVIGLFGFLSKKWAAQQHRYRTVLCDQPYKDRDPHKWSAAIVVFIWKEMHDIWKQRCAIAHRKSEQHRSLQHRLRVEAAVQGIYSHKDNVGTIDRDMFEMTLEERLRQSNTVELQAWITTMEPAIKQAIEDHARRSTMNTTDIRTFFPQRKQVQHNHDIEDAKSPQFKPP